MDNYNVIFRKENGVLTWRSFESRAQYDEIEDLFGKPVQEGVSEERAKKICEKSLERLGVFF